MIRESLRADAINAMLYYYPNSAYFDDRPSTGASTSSNMGGATPPRYPYWVKLVRTGSTFTAYNSPDGSTWTQVSTPTNISMAQNALIGLAVCGTSYLETATFDNVSVIIGTSPYISGISPLSAGVGATVTIAGSNFGATQGASTVQLNGANASVVSWSDTQIIVTVPAGITAGAGPVVVTVNSIASNSNVQFTAINPVLNSLAPPSAAVGGTVTLTGTGFGSATNQVMFGGVQGNIASWSTTSIQVTVPSGATSAPVSVVINGFSSNGLPFTVEGQPNTASVFPNMGTVGSTVTISGSGFGASQSTSTVNFNGVNATVTSWSDTEIEATVPAGATTGPVGVTVAGLRGTAAPFTVTSDVQLTDSAGNVTDYTFSMQGGTWHTIASQGSGCSSCTVRGVTQQDYDSSGNMLDETDALGHKVSYTYDGNSNMLSQSEPLDANTTVGWTYTYNSFGEVLAATDPLGNVTTNTYDTHGNLLTVTTPKPDANTAASVTTFAYNSLGELTTITDPLNHVTTLTYTAAGLIHTITDAQNNVTTYGYDAHGNRTSVIDAMSNETDFAYDAGDRLTTITYPDHTTTGFGYDYRGRRTSVTDQNGKTTTYAYDDADRLTSVTDAANHVTQYAYDDENNLVSITDANNHITSFQYDQFGRVKETDFPSGHAESYIYDPIGNLITKTDRNGNAITYVYDALNRLTHKGYPDSTAVDFVYDLVGKIKSATDPTGTYGFAYDNMGRLIGTTTQYTFLPGNTYTNSYTYDAASNRTGFTAPDGSTNTYAYDTLNRLSTLTNSLTGQFGFGYDTLSRRTLLTRPNGVNTSYSYDSLSRLLSVLHQNGATTIDGATYTLDSAGNRTSKQNWLNRITETYTYDPIYQLTQVDQIVNGNQSTTESYSYDAVGNRLSSLNVASYSYNNTNQLTSSADGYNYTYDANGNTLTKTNSSGTTTYGWDFENHLTSVTLPNGGGVVSLRYDPFGRRIYKSSSLGTSIFAYDGDYLIEEANSSGAVVARYAQVIYSIDEPMTMLRDGATSFYHQDSLGSITSVSSTAAALAQTYAFDSFGNQAVFSGSLTNSFRYAAREFDTESNLYSMRARYFDPVTGRFINEDPIGFAGMQANFYAYVGNDPIEFADPFGLRPLTDCEKQKLAPYIPKIDLDKADLHDGKVPWYLGKGYDGITRGNNIYFRPDVYDPSTVAGLALLGHELVHVGQYRHGLTWLKYLNASRHGYDKNPYEAPANDMQNKINKELKTGCGGCSQP